MRAPAVLCCPPIWWCVLRGSCTVTTPVRPAAVEHCIGWSVVGCVVARRVLYVALIVASLLQPNTPTTAGRTSAVVGVAVMLHIACIQFCTGAVRASLTHPCRISPRVVWRMLHGCVLYFCALRRAPVYAHGPCRCALHVPSARVARCIAARLLLHVASPHVACSTLHFASLHDLSVLVTSAHCMHVASVHRKRAALPVAQRRVMRCAACCTRAVVW
jgi:hypothetical protein